MVHVFLRVCARWRWGWRWTSVVKHFSKILIWYRSMFFRVYRWWSSALKITKDLASLFKLFSENLPKRLFELFINKSNQIRNHIVRNKHPWNSAMHRATHSSIDSLNNRCTDRCSWVEINSELLVTLLVAEFLVCSTSVKGS